MISDAEANKYQRWYCKNKKLISYAASVCILFAAISAVIVITKIHSDSFSPDTSVDGYSAGPKEGGIYAKVIEINPDGSIIVEVTGYDGFFQLGDVVTVSDGKENKKIIAAHFSIGDEIVVIYESYIKDAEHSIIYPGQVYLKDRDIE